MGQGSRDPVYDGRRGRLSKGKNKRKNLICQDLHLANKVPFYMGVSPWQITSQRIEWDPKRV